MVKSVINRAVEIKGSISKVWSVFSSPVLTKKMGLEHIVEWKVGNTLNWKELNNRFHTTALITQVEKEKLIQYNLLDKDDGKLLSVVTYEFHEKDEITCLYSKEEFNYDMTSKEANKVFEDRHSMLQNIKETVEHYMRKSLFNIRNGEMIAIRKVTDEELLQIESCTLSISEFDKYSQRLEIVRSAYKDVHDYLNSGNRTGSLNRLIIELLSLFRAFVDHWQADVTKIYGESSVSLEKFKYITGKQFDEVFAYRFFYKLRNYAQHCSMPNIHFQSKLGINDKPEYSLLLDKNELVNSYNEWGVKVKKDLISVDERFDIIPLLDDLMISLFLINIYMINNSLDLNKLRLSAHKILEYESLLKAEDYEIALIEYAEFYKSGNPKTLNINIFRFDICKFIIKHLKVEEEQI